MDSLGGRKTLYKFWLDDYPDQLSISVIPNTNLKKLYPNIQINWRSVKRENGFKYLEFINRGNSHFDVRGPQWEFLEVVWAEFKSNGKIIGRRKFYFGRRQ